MKIFNFSPRCLKKAKTPLCNIVLCNHYLFFLTTPWKPCSVKTLGAIVFPTGERNPARLSSSCSFSHVRAEGIGGP